MPNRILRDGFVDSEAVCALSDWAHRAYSNLLVKCDDAGRFDGRVEILRSHLFPLGTNKRSEDFTKTLDEMESRKLILRYEFDGKPYIQITKWQKCGKAESSRFPWRDGSHRIEYRQRETRDGPKDFVSTSILDGVGMGSVRGGYGVSTKTNTESDTESDTHTESETIKQKSTFVSTVAAKASAVADDSPVLITFPCVSGKRIGSNSWEFRQSLYDELRQAFPDVDVLSETRKALLWINTNTKKTHDGMPRFLLRWMGKAQNYSGRKPTKIVAKAGEGTITKFNPG